VAWVFEGKIRLRINRSAVTSCGLQVEIKSKPLSERNHRTYCAVIKHDYIIKHRLYSRLASILLCLRQAALHGGKIRKPSDGNAEGEGKERS
jgi:hypothetical protein